MFSGYCVLEILEKSIRDGLYGLYKQIKDEDKVIFEYHYVTGDLINLVTNEKIDMKEAVDKEINNEDYDSKYFKGTLKKIGDNMYICSAQYGDKMVNFEFSFQKGDGKWVERTIVLK